MYSIVIPIYRNEASIPDLLLILDGISKTLNSALEVVFVVDGSPDESFQRLAAELPNVPFNSKLIALSRNFGSFSASALPAKSHGPLLRSDGSGSAGTSRFDCGFLRRTCQRPS